MASIHVVRPRSKKKVLSRGKQMSKKEFEVMGLDGRVQAIRSLMGIGLMHIHEELDREVVELAGERYARKGEETELRRHGSNPGSVRLAGQRVGINVPRVRGPQGEVQLSSHKSFQESGDLDEMMFRRVLYGISCRDYEKATEAIPGAIGLSSSTVSRRFKQISAKHLQDLMERDLSELDIVALFVDGKSFADDQMIIALGVTLQGPKVILGICQTATENGRAIAQFFEDLKSRGLTVDEGILVIIDGGKGIRSAVKQAFKGRFLVQRCQWHKRENVVSYMPKSEQTSWRRRLQRAYSRPTYAEAKGELNQILTELDRLNQSAAGSLREGLEDTLTLHRIGIFSTLGLSLKTTNCIESLNSMAERRCGKVKSWKNSDQKQRWLASALWDIEPRLRKIRGYKNLPKLRAALQRELKIEERELQKTG